MDLSRLFRGVGERAVPVVPVELVRECIELGGRFEARAFDQEYAGPSIVTGKVLPEGFGLGMAVTPRPIMPCPKPANGTDNLSATARAPITIGTRTRVVIPTAFNSTIARAWLQEGDP
jgi:hypothetical protein